MEAQILEPQSFGVLLESEVMPTRLGGDGTRFYGAEGIDGFAGILQGFHMAHPYLDTELMYSWAPDPTLDEGELKAAYLLQYITLFRNSAVRSFLVDCSVREASGEEGGARALAYLARYVDTDRFAEVAAPALETLGVKGANELFADFDSDTLQTRQIKAASLLLGDYQNGVVPTGSHLLWNFTSATGVLDWYAGSGCRDLSVLTGEDDRSALTARLDGKAAYADLAHHFQAPVDLSFAPFMSFELGLQSAVASRYELQLRLVGERDTVIATTILQPNHNQIICVDLSESAQTLSAVRSIRLVARPLDAECEEFELRLYTYTLQSITLTNAEMAERVSAIQQTAEQRDDVEAPERDWTLPLVVSAIVLLVSIAIIAVLVISRRSRRLINNKKGYYYEKHLP